MGPIEIANQLGRWATGRGPLYLLLAAKLRQLIDQGVIPPETPLPPDRSLAETLAVGRGTVINAYELLRNEGRIVRHQGSGTRVAAAILPTALQGKEAVDNPLMLHTLDPPDGVTLLTCAAPLTPPPELPIAYGEAAQRLATIRGDLGYHPAGLPELRKGLARRFSERGVPTEPEQILVTTGGQQALALLAGLLIRPGDRVLTEAPTYPGTLELFREAAAVIVSGDFMAELRKRPVLAHFNPVNHNPTGTTMNVLERRRIAAIALAEDVPLIEDEVSAELSFDGTMQPAIADVITVGSLSKLIWGGIRVGWIRAPKALITRLARLKAIYDLGGEYVSQLAAAILIPQLEDIRVRRVAELHRNHDHLLAELADHLPDWEVAPATGGQTVWVRLPRGTAAAYAQVAMRHGVAVPPGSAFDPTGGSHDFIRLPFLHDPGEITEAVGKLTSAWNAYDGSTRHVSMQALVV